MKWLRGWLFRLGELFRKERRERELAAEMESHLQMHIEDNLRAGMSAAEARRQALIKLGGVEQTKEIVRERRGLPMLEVLLQDLRFALRMLRKKPGFAAAAVLTLALGIGANTTIFSVMNSIFFRPLPFREVDHLVVLSERNVQNQVWQRNPAMATVFDWQKHARSFAQIELAVNNEETANLTIGNETERLKVQFVSPGLPEMLGIRPVLGRGFDALEPTMSGASGGLYNNLLISHAMWQRHWGGDPGVLGKHLDLLNATFTIVGVMPPNAWVFPWLKDVDVWISANPASSSKEFPPELRWLSVIARLRPGASLRQAQAEMNVFGEQLTQAHPETNRDWTAEALPLQESWFGNDTKSFYMLMGAVGFVLLIACANVGNLLFARAQARTTEMAIRASMGGTRARIVRQLLTESVVLALFGGILGLALSFWGVKLFVALLPELGTLADIVVIDGRVLAFTLGLATLTGILFGIVPAFRMSAIDLNRCLKEGGDRSGGSRHMGGNLLVVAEVALTLILLAGAGLMVNSFIRLQGVDLGFNPANLLTANVELDGVKYKEFVEGDIQRVTPAVDDFFQHTVERLQRLSGVVSAALEGSASECSLRILGRSQEGGEQSGGRFAEADAGYFYAMQIALVEGRSLSANDDERSPWVAVINATMAKRFFPRESSLGKRVSLTFADSGGRKIAETYAREIVGVVGDAKESGPSRQATAMIYVPHRQHIRDYLGGVAYTHLSKRLLLRTSGNPLAMTRAVRSAVGEVDRTQVVTDIRSMEQIIAESVSPWRFMMQILSILSIIAVTLAAVGIFGVMSYTVSRRTHEIGLRMALGAGSGDMARLVLNYGLRLTVPGIALGLAGAMGVTRLIGSVLYGVGPTDPLTYVVVSLLLFLVAGLASYIPARRAMKVDPLVALRYE
jgi:predicted permease